jgi:4-amino-4-deoxy-L-arabinose transferase-like glycosyltransferase
MPIRSLKILILIAFITILVLHHFTSYLGHYGYDDMQYAKLANDLSNGIFNPENHFSYRLTLIGLTSLSYQLFGVNDFASALPALLVSVGSLLLIFIILRKEKPTIIALGLVFFSLDFWSLFYSDKLMPDVFVAFSVLLSLFFIYEFKFRKTKISTGVYAFAAAFAVFLGFNSKGTILLFFPLLAYFFIIDLFHKKDRKFWALFIGYSLVLVAGYFVFWQINSGNALARFTAITQNSYLNLCSYSEQPFIFTLKRISYGLVLLFISGALAVPFIFLAGAGTVKKEVWFFRDEKSFFMSSAVILVLSSNLMSISLSSYSPMCLDPRHYLFVVPVAGIGAALALKDLFNRKTGGLLLLLVTVVVFAVSVAKGYDTAWKLYLPLVLAVLVFFVMKKHPQREPAFLILLTAALLINPVMMARYAKKVNFRKQEQIVKEQLLSQDEPCVVLTDQVQKNVARYLSGFSLENPCTFYTYQEFDTLQQKPELPVFLLKNWYTSYLSKTEEHKLPYYARMTQNQQEVFEDPVLNIRIYRLIDFTRPEKLIESTNQFELPVPFWSEGQLDRQHVWTGSYSAKVEEYSPTFSINTDSLQTEGLSQLILASSFHLKLEEESGPLLVISVDKEQENKFWKGISLKDQVKIYGNWVPVVVNEIVDVKEVPPGSVLSIYIWNQAKAEMYLDDFNIEISGISMANQSSQHHD